MTDTNCAAATAADLDPRRQCDHICLNRHDHVDRGEPHFYGYELPSRRDPQTHLWWLARAMRENSERWFPRWHSDDLGMPLRVAYALGLAGEVGEVANVVKKLQRDGESPEQLANLGPELADCFTYLLLLADECDVDLVKEYEAKVEINRQRWETCPECGSFTRVGCGAKWHDTAPVTPRSGCAHGWAECRLCAGYVVEQHRG